MSWLPSMHTTAHFMGLVFQGRGKTALAEALPVPLGEPQNTLSKTLKSCYLRNGRLSSRKEPQVRARALASRVI